jgi:iron(III) transport system ATP-binding protein
MLRIDSLTKTFRSGSDVVRAVDGITLDVIPGELVVLLGPSGCGKTTLLRCLAGLESADQGRITFGDRTVYDSQRGIDVAPNKRNIGMVFQSYALWPHKTVQANVAYPLKVRNMKHQLRDGWVEAAAELVDCGHLLGRYPAQLSGGQQQRVALARALVARPDVLLFDEPLSNLDALLRTQVRNELHELHGRIGFTGVYVTHDQSEALAIADRLVIMRSGRIDQVGNPHDVYEHPASEYAAQFVGFANRLALRRNGTGWLTPHGEPVEGEVPVEHGTDEVHLRFRPEVADVATAGSTRPGWLSVPATLVDAVYAGAHDELTLKAGDASVLVRTSAPRPVAPGGAVALLLPARRCRFYWSARDVPESSEPAGTIL